MQEQIKQEEKLVKEKLVNDALLVAALVGLPLMVAAVVRANILQNLFFLTTHVTMYLLVLLVTLLRNKIAFHWRANTIIAVLIILALIDLLQTGFVSIGVLWLTAAVILSVLFFDFRRGQYCLVLCLLMIGTVFLLDKSGFLVYNVDYQAYARAPVIIVMRTFAFLATSLIIIFSIRRIYGTLNSSNDLLSMQKADLIKTTERLKSEMAVRQKTEQQALDNEYKFKSIFELSADPILVVDLQGRIIDFNHSFIELSQRTATELSMIDYLSIIPESYHDFFSTFKNRLKELPGRLELRYQNNQGKAMYLDVSVSVINYPSGEAILAVFRDNTERINRDKLMYSAVLEAEERERLNLSRELHDGLGPLLSTLKIYFDVLEKRPGDPEIISRIHNILSESIKTVKAISNNLSPYMLQSLGIEKALQGFIHNVSVNEFPKIELNSNIHTRLSEKVEITVYRMLTELLNNSLKHARANHILIQLLLDKQTLTISYSDDGIGFDMDQKNQQVSGIGLFNIKNRIDKFGGTINMESQEGKGFQLNAYLNVNEIS